MRAVAALLAALLLLGLTACGQEETKEPETMGEILLQEFEAQYQADPQADLDAMAQAILSQEVIGFQGTTAPVEPGTLMGFGGTDIQGFSQGVMFAPFIGAIPFLGYLFRLDGTPTGTPLSKPWRTTPTCAGTSVPRPTSASSAGRATWSFSSCAPGPWRRTPPPGRTRPSQPALSPPGWRTSLSQLTLRPRPSPDPACRPVPPGGPFLPLVMGEKMGYDGENQKKGASLMDTAAILSHVDHTLLKPEATWDQIKTLCDEAMEFGCATVCIPPAYVKQAADYVQGNLKICTVIGFPNGYNTMAAKIFEAKDAVENGASEIDMVINIGWVKDRKWKELAEEIAGVKAACLGRPLKVIIETCLLSDMEKIKLCQVVAKAEAAYLKTSTGFSTGGATREDVALLRENLPESVKVKASGGIRTLEDGAAYLELGADRLGASALVGEARKEQA